MDGMAIHLLMSRMSKLPSIIYEKDSFVPLVQAVYAEEIELHQTPVWADKPYSLQSDPLWKVTKTAKDFKDFWFYHCDHLGTPQKMTDHTGSIIWKAEYKAWGECKAEKAKSNFFEDSEIISNNIRFQGQYFDQETGFHYNRYRYYSPYVGRFISKNPIGLLGGFNGYVYAPNPIGWVDPYGLNNNPLVGIDLSNKSRSEIENILSNSSEVNYKGGLLIRSSCNGNGMIIVKQQ